MKHEARIGNMMQTRVANIVNESGAKPVIIASKKFSA